jgi:CRP-like cAMP-binding protein
MMMSADAYLPLLKRNHIFHGLTDEQILDFAQSLKVEQRHAGDLIVKQAERAENFYIIERGRVKLTRLDGQKARTLATYVQGDHFGATDLLEEKPRFATIVAETDVQLWRCNKDDFHRLLTRYPRLKLSLEADSASRKLIRRMRFSWLMPDEVLYLIVRRHSILLVQALVLPVVVEILVLVAAWAASVLVGLPVALGVLLIGTLPAAAWGVWNWIDWGNDFYIITNQRVVYLEKVVGIYDSRQESQLASVLSVSVQSAGSLERSLDMGDVVVRTFSGPIVMDSVPHPHALAAMVEEHWHRAKTDERRAERETIRQAIRRRIEPEPARPVQPQPAPIAKRPSLGESLARFFSFKVRFEEGDYITYRKHWFLLVRDVWVPSVLMLTLVVLPFVIWYAGLTAIAPLPVIVAVDLVAFIPLALWWLYEFVDWRNDIYQVATDQLIDINRKPLSKEVRKAAPLGNILSLRYERTGALGLFLNYGTVIANIGSAEFRFEGVFDPMGVQTDIYRRMEALSRQKAQAEIIKRRDEFSEWIGVYHSLMTEVQDPHSPKPPS